MCALRSITPSVKNCIRECGVVYDGILMRSLLVPFAALGILFTQSTLYDDSYGEYWPYVRYGYETLFNLGKHSFGHNNKHDVLKVST